MEKQVQTMNQNELVEIEGVKITRSQIDLIKRTIFVGCNDDELRLFFYECARRGVHPMDRMIYPVSRKDKEGNRRVTFQLGIDYLRAAAEETGRYGGQRSIEYGPNIKQATDEGDLTVPEWAEAKVLRRDSETNETAEIPYRVHWVEYYPGQRLGHMWRKMPHNQLGKCAEAAALRKAFPRKLGGLYINEEMEQAETVPFTPIPMPKEKQGPSGPPENGEQPAPNTISEAQRKRFYAIAKKTGATDQQIKDWLKEVYGLEHTGDIPKASYDEVCQRVDKEFSEPGAEG